MAPAHDLGTIAATLLLAACGSPGGSASPAPPVPGLAGARYHAVEIAAPIRGTGYDAEHTFVLSNAGPQAVLVTAARTTTSTTVTWEGYPEPLRIEPGASVGLPVRARTDGKALKRGRAVLVTSTGEEVELVLEIRVRPPTS